MSFLWFFCLLFWHISAVPSWAKYLYVETLLDCYKSRMTSIWIWTCVYIYTTASLKVGSWISSCTEAIRETWLTWMLLGGTYGWQFFLSLLRLHRGASIAMLWYTVIVFYVSSFRWRTLQKYVKSSNQVTLRFSMKLLLPSWRTSRLVFGLLTIPYAHCNHARV